MINKHLWYWDSYIAVVLYTRYRNNIISGRSNLHLNFWKSEKWKWKKWVFSIDYIYDLEKIRPEFPPEHEILNDFFFERIISDIYLDIIPEEEWRYVTDDEWYIVQNLVFTKKDTLRLKNDFASNLFSSIKKNIKDPNANSSLFYIFNVRINEKKLKEKLDEIMQLWKEWRYFFSSDFHRNILKIDKQLKMVVDYIIKKSKECEPNNLYVSIAEIFWIIPELKEKENWEKYYFYRYFKGDHIDPICCLYFLDQIGAIYIHEDSSWFGKDEPICFRVSILNEFHKLFSDTDTHNDVLKVLKKGWILIPWDIPKKKDVLNKLLDNERIKNIEYKHNGLYIIRHASRKTLPISLSVNQNLLMKKIWDDRFIYRDNHEDRSWKLINLGSSDMIRALKGIQGKVNKINWSEIIKISGGKEKLFELRLYYS
ncbi:MAG: hypothetical protein ACD_78C00274G0007 [uncultured bacterium (gcode 4)]|uniref:Uncharacterized protein n=1 Tax=uncultured bacterium (gcode 4) TaxID=1234023 RepID=K1XHH6_9BACT|nr:MAG: hypothetical protein ACD_78C00274G0007 [uncultured bacterium (gcode 4)]